MNELLERQRTLVRDGAAIFAELARERFDIRAEAERAIESAGERAREAAEHVNEVAASVTAALDDARGKVAQHLAVASNTTATPTLPEVQIPEYQTSSASGKNPAEALEACRLRAQVLADKALASGKPSQRVGCIGLLLVGLAMISLDALGEQSVYICGTGVAMIWFAAASQRSSRRRSALDRLDKIARMAGEANFWRDREVERLAEVEATEVRAAQEVEQAKLSEVTAAKRSQLEALQPAMELLASQLSALAPAWTDDDAWSTWQLPTTAQGVARAGTLRAEGDLSFELPACLPFPGGRPVLVSASGEARASGLAGMQAMLVRMLASLPPGRLWFTFIDPIGLGNHAAAFLHLGDERPELINSRVWTDARHIDDRLSEITEHMQTVIQKYLRDDFADIEAYNAQAGEIAEPYRVVAVFDFPTNFTEDTARRLLSIAQQGPRCGVYLVVHADGGLPVPHGFDMESLRRACTVIEFTGDGARLLEEHHAAFALDMESLGVSSHDEALIRRIQEASREGQRVEVPYASIEPTSAERWSESAESALLAHVGRRGARDVFAFRFDGENLPSAVMIGRPGSGKTTLLHIMITDIALRYAPDEVELYLVDFKEGVEFKIYAEHELPHARVVAIESEREFGLSVLDGLDAEIERRGAVLRQAGCQNLLQYRRQMPDQPKMRRILLVVDEFQVLFEEEDAIASRAAQILDRIVRLGRAFGVHCLLASQSLSGSYALARSTINLIPIRMALMSSEDDSRLVFADDNNEARLLSRPGETIYNAQSGLVKGNVRFQCAWLGRDEQVLLLEELRRLASTRSVQRETPMVVFDGNAPADIKDNAALVQADLGANTHLDGDPNLWLGEPIALQPPLALRMRRQSGANALIVGRSLDLADGLLACILISAAATAHEESDLGLAPIQLLDFALTDDGSGDVLRQLASDDRVRGKIGVVRRRQLPDAIAQVAAEVDRREDDASARRSPLFVIVRALQSVRDLHADSSTSFSFSFDAEPAATGTPAEHFAKIVRLGPDVGVHTIAWANAMAGAEKAMGHGLLREFGFRVALQMPVDDSSRLIDSPRAGSLGPNRALLFDLDEGTIVKFRPYSGESVRRFIAGSPPGS